VSLPGRVSPRGGFITREGKWAVENEGVAPDIDVENWPKDVIARLRPAARTRRRGGDEAAQGEAVRSDDDGTAASNVGTEKG
jgi:tricorn protease